MEMREDIKGLRAAVDAIARDQALGLERRAAMQRSADSIYDRLDGHDRDLDRMQAWAGPRRRGPRPRALRAPCQPTDTPTRGSVGRSQWGSA
jgi:hypothetical protein